MAKYPGTEEKLKKNTCIFTIESLYPHPYAINHDLGPGILRILEKRSMLINTIMQAV